MGFERIDSREVWQGRIVGVREDRFRYDDGTESDREIVTHKGAVVILPFDGKRFWMVRQPREAVGEQSLLELPAGLLDKEGEVPEDAARRELAEEVGKAARSWKLLARFYNSPGVLTEETHLFLAEDLYDESLDSGEMERIEIVAVPVADLDATIAEVRDAQALVGLLWFRAYLAG